jgi:putative transposase
MAESFFATLECELLERRRFKTHAEAKMAIFEFIESFYNLRRSRPLGAVARAPCREHRAPAWWQASSPSTSQRSVD